MNLNKFKKMVEKEYYRNNQQMLYVTTLTDWHWRPKNRCAFDIILTDKEGKEFGNYLFDIQNLNAFKDLEIKAEWSKMKRLNRDFYETSWLVDSASVPFYMNQIFTLKKFENITQKDIYNCTNYLIKKVLDCWFVWNIRVVIPPKERKGDV